jgi:dihydrofolate synthase/folylpolyglutamate synthase
MLRKTTLQESLAALHWPGRMEILSQNPFMLLDACINRTSAEEVLKTLRALDIKDITCIIGIPDDKDFLGVTQCMQPIAKHIILTRSQNPHYVFTIKQKDILEDQGIKAEWMDSLKSALELAKRYDDKIIILGTTSVVGEVALYIRKMKH